MAEFQGAASALEQFGGAAAEEEGEADGNRPSVDPEALMFNIDASFDETFGPEPPAPGPALSPPPPPPMGSPAPAAVGPAEPSSGGRSPRFWALLAIGITAILSLAAVAITFIVTSGSNNAERDGEPTSQVILVKGNVVAEGTKMASQPTPAKSAPAPAEQPDAQVAAPTEPAGRPTPKRHSGDRSGIARAFASQRSKIAGCFETHALDVQGAPQIIIDFVVNADGTVRSVALEPAAVRGSALGRCISKVAASTRFDRQESAVEFRIPIKARRLP